MGQRSFLRFQFGNYETNNCLGLGWFFIYDQSNFRIYYDRGFHPDGDEWEWPGEEEEGEEQCELAYLTTAEKALSIFDRRMANIKSPYLKEFLSCLGILRTNLIRCKPTDEIYLTCIEFTGLWDSDMKCADFIRKLPENIDKALSNPNYLEFYELLQQTMPDAKMSGNIADDLQEYAKEKYEIADALLGGFWDYEKSKEREKPNDVPKITEKK